MKRSHRKILLIILVALSVSAGVLLFVLRCGATHDADREGGRVKQPHTGEVETAEEEEVSADGDIVVGECYQLFVNDDTAFICITALQGGRVEGVAYLLTDSSAWVTPQPFEYVSRIFSNYLEFAGDTYSFKRTGTLHNWIDGAVHVIYDKQGVGYRVQAMPYRCPPFEVVVDSSYRKAFYRVGATRDILYGQAKGYWTAHEWDTEKSYVRIALEGVRNTMNYTDLPLKLDLYSPIEDSATNYFRPLILWLHGGAYYVNDKCEESIVEWCKYFASLGYFCASIDYRQGFFPTREGLERAGYMAVQDAHAAMRYLVCNAERYGIDTAGLFVAGASAGAIAALNLAFMTERERPPSSYGVENRRIRRARRDTTRREVRESRDDLGALHGSGNNLQATFRIKAVANLWGAVHDLNELRNSRTHIISVHGDADLMVPYEKGFPFQDQTNIGKHLIGNLYGSASIHRKAQALGLRSRLVTLPGMGHAPQFTEQRTLNRPVFNLIKDSITTFFYEELVPQPAIIRHDSNDACRYYLTTQPLQELHWEVVGGFVVQQSQYHIRVVWRSDASEHRLRAAGRYRNGIGFTIQYEEDELLSRSLFADNNTSDTAL